LRLPRRFAPRNDRKYSPSPLPCAVDNSLHRAGHLPPRGEGVRRRIFTPLLIKLQKRSDFTG